MSIVNFVKADVPCVRTETVLWHVKHGWWWNVEYHGSAIGVFFCDIIGGNGVVCHFDTVKHIKIPPAAVLGAMRKGVEMVKQVCPVVLAIIPKTKWHLIRCCLRMGFQIVTNYRDGEEQLKVLQYFGRRKSYCIR